MITREDGFLLGEFLVAFAVILILLVALTHEQLTLFRQLNYSEQRKKAARIFSESKEALRFTLAQSSVVSPTTFAISVPDSPSPLSAVCEPIASPGITFTTVSCRLLPPADLSVALPFSDSFLLSY